MQDVQSETNPAPDGELTCRCAGCDRVMDLTDGFCRHCGRQRGKASPLHQRPWVVLSLLFFVVGPLALPMLWRSESFSRSQKVLISAANLAFVGGLALGVLLLFNNYMKILRDIAGG